MVRGPVAACASCTRRTMPERGSCHTSFLPSFPSWNPRRALAVDLSLAALSLPSLSSSSSSPSFFFFFVFLSACPFPYTLDGFFLLLRLLRLLLLLLPLFLFFISRLFHFCSPFFFFSFFFASLYFDEVSALSILARISSGLYAPPLDLLAYSPRQLAGVSLVS